MVATSYVPKYSRHQLDFLTQSNRPSEIVIIEGSEKLSIFEVVAVEDTGNRKQGPRQKEGSPLRALEFKALKTRYSYFVSL
jgi:hypothetical protein